MTYREMEDGMGELEALRRFGERNPLREYRKLALLLEQNLRREPGNFWRCWIREGAACL